MKKTLDHMKRNDVIQLAWGEMIVSSKKSMAVLLLHYLSGTEQTEKLRGYYKTMGYLMNNKTELKASIKKCPKRPRVQKSPYRLKNLCRLFRKSGGKFR